MEDWKKMPIIAINIIDGPKEQLFENGDLALRKDTKQYVEVKSYNQKEKSYEIRVEGPPDEEQLKEILA